MHIQTYAGTGNAGSTYVFVPPKARLRPHTKSRNGCTTCKLRRIKCQESRPECSNCLRKGYVCKYPPFRQELARASKTGLEMNLEKQQSSLPVEICTSKVIESEMLSMFAPTYGKGWMLGRTGFLDRFSTMNPTELLLRTTIKSLCLAHMSIEQKDDKLKHASARVYTNAVGLLRRTVDQVVQHSYIEPPADVLTTIMVIGLYDEADLPGQSTQSHVAARWSHHFDGAQRLVKAYGQSMFDLAQPFEAELLLTLWLLAWSTNLAARQPMHLDLQAWQDFNMGHFFRATPFEGWHETIIPLPALISAVDIALADKSSPSRSYYNYVSRLLEIRERLDIWLSTNMTGSDSIYNDDIIALDPRIEEQAFMLCQSSCIPTQIRFKDMQLGIFSTLSMLASLICDCTVLRIIYAHPNVPSVDAGHRASNVRKHAYNTAVDLCRAICFLSQQETTGYRDLEHEILSLCARFFVECEAVAEATWCEHCLFALTLRSKRLEHVSQRRLNPISESRGALEDYGRFLGQR